MAISHKIGGEIMAKGKKKANAKTKKLAKQNKAVAAAEKKEAVTVQ